MNIRNQNKNLQSMEDELNEIKKLSLYSRDLFASFDALTVAINNIEEKYKAFFLGLLEESKKLAAELHTASRKKDNFDFKSVGLENNILLLIESNNLTAAILNHKSGDKPIATSTYFNCVKALDATIEDYENKLDEKLKTSKKRWEKLKKGLVAVIAIALITAALVASILTGQFIFTACIVGATLITGVMALQCVACGNLAADIDEATGWDKAEKRAIKREENERFNKELSLFKDTNKIYHAHIDTKNFAYIYEPSTIAARIGK